MDIKRKQLNKKTHYKWQVIEGIVNTSDDYIKIFHEDYTLPYALLQSGRCRTVIVEYHAGDKPWYATVQNTLEKIRDEIAYYILQQRTLDNWKSAVKRAQSSTCVCSKIHWTWIEKGKPLPGKTRNSSQNNSHSKEGETSVEGLSPAKLQLKIGQTSLDDDDLDTALTALNRAIELDSKEAESYVYRGITQRRMSQKEHAIADFTTAIELSPEYDWAYANRAYVYYLYDQFPEALKDCNRAIELDSDYARYYSNRAAIYLGIAGEGDLELSVTDYDRAIELEPSNATYYKNKADVYIKMNRPDLVETSLKEALGVDPCDIQSFATLALAQVKWTD